MDHDIKCVTMGHKPKYLKNTSLLTGNEMEKKKRKYTILIPSHTKPYGYNFQQMRGADRSSDLPYLLIISEHCQSLI